ncbi:MAG: hypothetical protein ACI4MS_01620 [Candidatus Coproplasma sp.]
MTETRVNNNYIFFPEDYLMKSRKGNCIEKMRPQASRLLTLGLINHVQTVYNNDNAKILYKNFSDNLGFSKPTVCSALKSLINGGLIERTSQSHYNVSNDLNVDVTQGTAQKYITIYSFLLTEVMDFGKKTAKKLSPNAVLFLCNLVKHYSNKKRKQKYYVGGIRRVASFLNIPISTAQSVVKELHDVGAIFYKHEENTKLLDGFGENGYTPTIYVVNDKLLKRCAEVQKDANKRRRANEEQKRAPKSQSEKTTCSQTPNSQPNAVKFVQHNKVKGERVRKRYPDGISDWADALKRAKERDDADLKAKTPPNNNQ